MVGICPVSLPKKTKKAASNSKLCLFQSNTCMFEAYTLLTATSRLMALLLQYIYDMNRYISVDTHETERTGTLLIILTEHSDHYV